MADDAINLRKREHLIAVTHDYEIERQQSGFDRIQLIHRALPEIDYGHIDTQYTFLGKTLSFPLIISAMTGGNDQQLTEINQRLATAAEICQVAMAVGSQRIMMDKGNARESFNLRGYAPSTVLLGNLGAVQLNYGYGINECRQAVEILDADGLYLHLNPLQECIQPEGDTNFVQLIDKIASIHEKLHVPIILKEVGCGMSPRDIALGVKAGINIFDIAGRGGTSWSRIEYHRRCHDDDTIGLVFQDWGLTTVQVLKLAYAAFPDMTLIASGGIRSGIDMAKAVILGANICGVAAPFLHAALISTEAVIAKIRQLHREYQIALFLLGCDSHDSLRGQMQFILQDNLG